MDRAFHTAVIAFAGLSIGVVVFCFWLALSVGLWPIALGVLAGCYLVTVINYIRLLLQ